MKRNWNNLKYIVKHKWFVLLASLEIGAPISQALLHDLSKFRLSEWIPYAARFFAFDGSAQNCKTPAFERAWFLHQRRNPHHWQYWLLCTNHGIIKEMEIPRKYVLEMVADWMGAERTANGYWGACVWYEKNKDNMLLHPNTRKLVEDILRKIV